MAWYDEYLQHGGADRSANPTPGNKTGGLTNIVEKPWARRRRQRPAHWPVSLALASASRPRAHLCRHAREATSFVELYS